MLEMQANIISEDGAYKAKAAAFVNALKHQLTSQDEELANCHYHQGPRNCQHEVTDCASNWA